MIMLRKIDHIRGFSIAAHDRELGELRDVFFDDRTWQVRYLVVRTGGWLSGREVLLSPESVRGVHERDESISVALTAEQVRESPDVRSDLPVSRQDEWRLVQYYNWMPYWQPMGGYTPGPGVYPHQSQRSMVAPIHGGGTTPNARPAAAQPEGDTDLRSAEEIVGYRIHARDEEFGHVEDPIADVDDWIVRYLVVDTRNWLPSPSVLLAADWIERVDWSEREIRTDLDKKTIESAPEYDPEKSLTRDDEARLYDHYGRPPYWNESP
jgi:uncharacterized protein YrrD